MNYFVHESSYVDKGAIIGEGTKIWHFCHIMSKAKIGKHCNIGQNVFIGDNVVLGDNCKVQNNVSIYKGVIIGDDVFVGPSVVFTNIKAPRSFISRKNEYNKTVIKRGVTLGANSTIICGITLCEYSFIGAGSVVTKSVSPHTIVYGNPARIIGPVTRDANEIFNRLENKR